MPFDNEIMYSLNVNQEGNQFKYPRNVQLFLQKAHTGSARWRQMEGQWIIDYSSL